MIKNNPFTSDEFNAIWLKHFNNSKPSYSFDFIEHVVFYKSSLLPLFINVGKNLTKGIFYELISDTNDFKGKAFLVYDVPDYFNVDDNVGLVNKNLGLIKIFQYNGYVMDLTDFDSAEAYRKNQFKKHNKRYIRWSHIQRLETCFNITEEFLYGDISNEKYEFIFDHFFRLLNQRFEGKHTDYHHLEDKKWAFYKELILPLIRSKKASFLVIYNDGIPVGINLNYHADKILFKAITVFDTDYSKFSIGKLSVLKLLDWCYEHEYSFSDFSKGYFDYKDIWSNLKYDFNYHVLYDKTSLLATIIAKSIVAKYALKTFLRKHKINRLYRKFMFKFRGSKSHYKPITEIDTESLLDFNSTEAYEVVDVKEDHYDYLRSHVNNFLFSNPEPFNNIRVYKHKIENTVIIQGSHKAIKLNF